MSRFLIPRRTFLKGAGASILLPMLDIMMPPRAYGAVPVGTPRFAMFFMSLGIYGEGLDVTKNGLQRYFYAAPYTDRGMGGWKPGRIGALTDKLPPHLAPFESLKNKITVVSGLSSMPGDVNEPVTNHSTATTSWACAAWNSTADAQGKNGSPPDSIDQFIANAYGVTPGSTIVFNPSNYDVVEGNGGHCGFISSNSKLGGNNLVPRMQDPVKMFNQLFGVCTTTGGNVGQVNDEKSILDAVMESTRQLQKKLGKDDSNRLEAYFQNIREVELSLKAVPGTNCPTQPAFDPKLNGGALDWLGIMRMAIDVTALAMATDAMPIASIMTDTEAEGTEAYGARVQVGSDYTNSVGQKINYATTRNAHFDIVHSAKPHLYEAAEGFTPEARLQVIEEHMAFTRLNMLLFRRLADKLDQLPAEPNGNTPLDNSLLMVGACHSHSCSHNTHNLPIMLAGGKKFKMRQGQHVNFPLRTHLGRLYYTMAKSLGVTANNFNGHTSILPGVFD